MENIKENICKNLVLLRKTNKLTQQEFAKIFNYSDKAVSRWERGDSLPSIEVLTQICEYYGVEFSWLISNNEEVKVTAPNKLNVWYRVGLILLFAVCVFTIATIAFVYFQVAQGIYLYQFFVWSVPISLFGAFCYTKRWGMKNCQFYLLSATMWTFLVSVYVQTLEFNVWPIFLTGVPLQLTFVLLFLMAKIKK